MYIYYVYAYLRNKDSKHGKKGTPYYIGKGKLNRAFEKHSNLPVPKDKSNIIFIEIQLSEIGALAIERRMIRWYGRKDTGTGILLNRTEGGDGTSGRKDSACTIKKRIETRQANGTNIISEETKQKMRIAATARIPHKHSSESKLKISESKKGSNNSFYRKTHTLENRAKMGHKKGKLDTLETRAKKSAAMKGKPKPKTISRIFDRKEMGVANFTRWLNLITH